jgi:zona occludens toxin
MIELLSATPGSGKSLKATKKLLDLSRDNIANLKHNYFYAKAFFEKLSNLKLNEYLDIILVTRGQGLERTAEILFLEPDFFDFLKIEYNINVISNPNTDDIVTNYPAYYFERITLLNTIIDNLNINENTKFQHFKPVRSIYTNIADLKLVQCRPLPKDCDWRTTPQGSFFAIDEAQLINIFSDEARGIDPIVKDLTIHRHKGYDFLFITQEPSFVHKYIRKLASHHTHLVNIFGWEQSMMLEWSVVQDSPNAVKSIARCENLTRWKFPKEIYPLYKSSTAHTRVKRIPKKLVIFVCLAIFFFTIPAALLLFAGKNPLPFLSSNDYSQTTEQAKSNEKSKESKSSDARTNGNSVQQSATNSKQSANQDSNPVDQADASSVASTNVSATNAQAPVQPSYDPSKPYDFVPVSQPNVVNHRLFSGCVTYQGKTFAVDQQGTKIAGFSASDCKKLLDNSYDRPFDYFGQRNQTVQSRERVSTSDSGSINPETPSL